jgi:serine/threonine protein kinase
MTARTDDLRPGSVIAGKYRLERVIGRGGMGVVAAAQHLELGTRVAIKLLQPGGLDAEEALERFAREARAASRMRGEHVARVYDVGRTAGGGPYMVMEYLVGQDLDALLAGAGTLDVSVVVGYVLQACEAVAEAHGLGIVHRDLKPRNLFLTRRLHGEPLVKVLDFGIAKRVAIAHADRDLTGTLSIVGSPPYMSPEQLRASRDVDERSDVWSLGVCLYELATGQLPFDGATALDVCATVMKDDPRPPHEVRADVPEGLARVILRCLRRDPGERFQDVGALAEALEPFAPPADAGAAARVRQVLESAPLQEIEAAGELPGDRPPDGSDTRVAAALDSRRTGQRRLSRALWIGALVGGVAIASIVPWLALRAPRAQAPEAPRASVPAVGASAPSSEPPAPTAAQAPLVRAGAPSSELRLAPVDLRGPTRRLRGGHVPGAATEAATELATSATGMTTPPTLASPAPSEPAPAAPAAPASSAVETLASRPPPYRVESAHAIVAAPTNVVGTTATNVQRALGGLAAQATRCYREALPRGTVPYDGAGTLHVETDDEGIVVVARYAGPLAGTLGPCIAAATRGRRVPDVDTGRVRADVAITLVGR